MAKKFVKVNGLHNVFEASANIASSTIKSGASASVDANSILFITADAEDEEIFGGSYPSMKEGAHYIWAQGVLHDTNSGLLNVTLDGGDYLNTNGSYLSPGEAHFVVNHDESGATAGTFGMAGASSVGAGGSIVVKVPKFTVDKYGHLTAASEANLTIGVPAAETHKMSNHKALTMIVGGGTIVYGTTAATTVDIDAAIDKKIAPFENAMHFVGKATVDLTDGATTAATALGITGYTAADKGDIVLDKSGIHEYIWTGSAWEQIGYLVGATGAAITKPTYGSTYKIGQITIEGKTVEFIGKDTDTPVSYTDTSKTGTTYEIGKITIGATTTTLIGRDNDTKYGVTNGLVAQTGGTIFQADLHSHTKFGATAVASSSASRYYQVGLDAAGKLAVNVPWQANTNTAHTHSVGVGIGVTGTAKTGNTTNGDCRFYLKPASTSEIGGIAIGYPESGKNYPVELNSSNQAFVNVPWINYGGSGGVGLHDKNFYLLKPTDGVRGGIRIGYSGTGKNYPVQLNEYDQAYVSVPWADAVQPNNGTLTLKIAGTVGATHSANTSANATFDVPVASSSAYGVIKTGFAEANGVKKYAVKLDSNNKAYVEVPWTYTDTNTAHGHAAGDGIILSGGSALGGTITIGVTAATATKYGGIKTNYTASGKNYPVKLDTNGNAYVNVPWTDRITYGLSGVVVGTTGSAAANTSVTTAVASAVSFVDTLTPSSGTATKSTCILMNGDGSINLKTVSGKNNAIEIDYTGVATAEDWATIG